MPWWGRERDGIEPVQSGGPPFGQIRILVVGDSGVGKTSIVHLILKGSSIAHPRPTIGCAVGVKHISHGSASMSSNNLKGDGENDFFVELWDISGHDRYKDCRHLFYTQISGVILVHDLSQRRTKASLSKWAVEIASKGTFSVPFGSDGIGGLLPVPYLIIANKTDLSSNQRHGSSGNLVDVARMWVEKQGLLPSSEDLPLTDSFPGSSSLLAAAKEARYDKEAVMKFFKQLIRRRYFPDEQPAPTPWPVPPVPNSELLDNQFQSSFRVHSQRNYANSYSFERLSESRYSESDISKVEIDSIQIQP